MVKKKKDDPSGIFVGAGIILGMGAGFLWGNLLAGLFIGLGLGLAVMGIIQVRRK